MSRLRTLDVHLLGRIQHLQTVCVEASYAFRHQCAHVMQAQVIRLEDLADSEIEDVSGMDQCTNELMLTVLYTELRRDIRAVADTLEDIQHQALSSNPATAAAGSVSQTPMEAGTSTDEMVTADTHRDDGTAASGESMVTAPPPLSSRSETFSTARGVPMGFAEHDDAAVSDAEEHEHGADRESVDTEAVLEDAERKLFSACVEIDEWRRTQCVCEFIASMKQAMAHHQVGSQAPSVRSAVSARLPVAHWIDEMRDRQRERAQSIGHHPVGLSMYSGDVANGMASLGFSPPPLSRLLQVEREIESSRLTPPTRSLSERRASAMSNEIAGTVHSPLSAAASTGYVDGSNGSLTPWGQARPAQASGTLHLLGPESGSAGARGSSGQQNARYQTFVDDVRIVGWVTRGSGLDVHTEFKVIVHLTRGENLTVMRRYTDFEVLREVLCDHYRTFSKRIPRLPRKKAFGKFENSFLKKRENALQFFLAYVMLHPVIGCSSVIRQWLEPPVAP